MSDVPECGWCGTPFDKPPWCDHCYEERDNAHVTRLSSEDKQRGYDGIGAARQALREARARKQAG